MPSKYLKVASGPRAYFHSIPPASRGEELDPIEVFTKALAGIYWSGWSRRAYKRVLQLMDDLRAADVDFMTIGQYLAPTRKHHPVIRYVTPEEFKAYATTARAKGFLLVSSTPLTRSSYHADEDFAKLKAARLGKPGH